LKFSFLTAGTATLEWLDIALDEKYYVLERSSDGGRVFEIVAQPTENSQSYTDKNLARGNYLYRIKAVNGIGSSAYSNPIQISF
jgi:hypothetical protein